MAKSSPTKLDLTKQIESLTTQMEVYETTLGAMEIASLIASQMQDLFDWKPADGIQYALPSINREAMAYFKFFDREMLSYWYVCVMPGRQLATIRLARHLRMQKVKIDSNGLTDQGLIVLEGCVALRNRLLAQRDGQVPAAVHSMIYGNDDQESLRVMRRLRRITDRQDTAQNQED